VRSVNEEVGVQKIHKKTAQNNHTQRNTKDNKYGLKTDVKNEEIVKTTTTNG
jgi:hypothetical protein